MTSLHKIPPAPPANTHSRPTQAGHDWSSGPWKYPPQPVKTPWLESNLAMMILAGVLCALTWTLADYVLTRAMTEPSILVD